MKYISMIVVFVAIASACTKKKEFRYTNPIRNGIEAGIRDAQIINDNGKYYLVGTCAPFWPKDGKNPGVKIYSSDDLLNWKFEKFLINRNDIDSNAWYLDRFWAPEIAKIADKYYLTFNCRNETTPGSLHAQGCGIAVADNILGPYDIITKDQPLANGNDLSLFEDTNGEVYAFWNGDKRMNVAKINMDSISLIPETYRVIFTPDSNTWDMAGIEGPYCVKHEDTYYLFYSSWTRGYEIGYARASNPLGPWFKYINNPIYGAQSKPACAKNNMRYTQSSEVPFNQVGHNALWKGPDGRYWISCHGIAKSNPTPALMIDPINFVDGKIVATGPTFNEQIIIY